MAVQINENSVLQSYYASWESRIGYHLMLGGTRHYGYYEKPNAWPLPVGPALRAMENQLYIGLQCPQGSRVLDAGCGYGHVAVSMARKGGYEVQAIDVVARHAERARRYIAGAKLQNQITASRADYHHLEHFDAASFDGVYTMETLVHSTDPLAVLKGFFRLLKPGGRIALNEYDHDDLDKSPKALAESMRKINQYAAMPANASFNHDVLKELVEQAGFEDVQLRDLSQNVLPMLWLFFIVAYIPCTLARLLGIEHRLVNALAGLEAYRGRHLWRYIQVTGRKPS